MQIPSHVVWSKYQFLSTRADSTGGEAVKGDFDQIDPPFPFTHIPPHHTTPQQHPSKGPNILMILYHYLAYSSTFYREHKSVEFMIEETNTHHFPSPNTTNHLPFNIKYTSRGFTMGPYNTPFHHGPLGHGFIPLLSL